MRIGFDMLAVQSAHHGHRGIGRYSRHLVAALLASGDGHQFVLYAHDGLPDDRIPRAPNAIVRWLGPESEHDGVSVTHRLDRLARTNPDALDVLVVLSPFEYWQDYHPPASSRNGLKLAAIVYDMIPFLYQSACPRPELDAVLPDPGGTAPLRRPAGHLRRQPRRLHPAARPARASASGRHDRRRQRPRLFPPRGTRGPGPTFGRAARTRHHPALRAQRRRHGLAEELPRPDRCIRESARTDSRRPSACHDLHRPPRGRREAPASRRGRRCGRRPGRHRRGQRFHPPDSLSALRRVRLPVALRGLRPPPARGHALRRGRRRRQQLVAARGRRRRRVAGQRRRPRRPRRQDRDDPSRPRAGRDAPHPRWTGLGGSAGSGSPGAPPRC